MQTKGGGEDGGDGGGGGEDGGDGGEEGGGGGNEGGDGGTRKACRQRQEEEDFNSTGKKKTEGGDYHSESIS